MDENATPETVVETPAAPTTPPPAEPPKLAPKAATHEPPKVVTKEMFDKTASELAAVKKQLQARMSADELAAAQAEEARMELETLRKERQTARLEVSLAKSGIENGAQIAELFASGDTEKAITALSAAKDAQIAELKKEITTLKQRGAMTPPVGEPNSPYAGKTVTELMQLANTNPDRLPQILEYIERMNKTKKE